MHIRVTEEDGKRAQELLADARAETEARVAGLEREFRQILDAAGAAGDDDEHDPEGATVAFERQHVAALLAGAREHLAQIDQARQRLAEGSYGRCERCGEPIGAERLIARPMATRCLTCASQPRR